MTSQKAARDVDSDSFHSWPHHGATSMDMSDSTHRKGVMADLEGRFYPHQRHQRHLSDSESVRSQGSFARSAMPYAPSKSPTLRSFDGAMSKSPRINEGSKSPRFFGGSKSPRSIEGSHSPRSVDESRSPKMDVASGSLSTCSEDYYEAVSQILGTSIPHSQTGSASSGGPTPSPHNGPTLSTFHPQAHQTVVLTTGSAPAPRGSAPSPEPPTSPRSPSLRDKIVKAFSPPSLRKKLRSPSPTKDQPHSPLSSPPVTKARKSKAKGAQASSPSGDAVPQQMEADHTQGFSFFTGREISKGIQETHFDVASQVKPLSPIGELLPVELTESPSTRRKETSTKWYMDHDIGYEDNLDHDNRSHEESQECSESPDQFQVILSSPEVEVKDLPTGPGFDCGEVSDYDNDRPETPPKVMPRKSKQKRGEIPVTPSNETYLSELETAERMLAVLGSPQNRMSKALSVPSDLQRSRDNLDSPADMGSIGSFSELSKSLNSLLNGVSTQEKYTPPQQDTSRVGYVAPGGPPNLVEADSQSMSNSLAQTDITSAAYYSSATFSVDSELHADIQAGLLNRMDVAHLVSSSPPTQDLISDDSENLDSSRGSCKTQANIGSELSSHRKRHSRAQRAKEALSVRLETEGLTDLMSDTDTDVVHLSEETGPHEETHKQTLGMSWTSHTTPPGGASQRSDTSNTQQLVQEGCVPRELSESRDVTSTEHPDCAYNIHVITATSPATRSSQTTLPEDILPTQCSETKQAHPPTKKAKPFPSKSSEHQDISTTSADTRRRHWVHAPKASMEDSNIETDSPPLERKAMLEEIENSQLDIDNTIDGTHVLEQKGLSPENAVAQRDISLGFHQPLSVDNRNEGSTDTSNPMTNRSENITSRLGKGVVVSRAHEKHQKDEQVTLDGKSQMEAISGVPIPWAKPPSAMVCSTGDDDVFSQDSDMSDLSFRQTDREPKIDAKPTVPYRKYANISSTNRGITNDNEARPRASSSGDSDDSQKRIPSEGQHGSARMGTPPKSEYPRNLQEDTPDSSEKENGQSTSKRERHTEAGTEGKDRKRHSPKRQKSVRELRSRFESLGGSPPRDQEPVPEPCEEPKFKPLIFQKPKIVHLKALSPTNTNAPSNVVDTPKSPTGNRASRKPEGKSPPSPVRGIRGGQEIEPETSQRESPTPSPRLEPKKSSETTGSDRWDSDDSDRMLTAAEEAEGSEKKVRKLSLMFERRNSARSDSLEPPLATLERRKRSDSARSDSSNEPVREENANNRRDRTDHAPSKMQKESDNEKISKQDAKAQEGIIETSVEKEKAKENKGVRHLSQMFERSRSSRSSSSEPGDNGYMGSRGPPPSDPRGFKTNKPWTAIV